MRLRNWPLLSVPLAAFLAMVPLLRYGCSCGDDLDFHLLNWIETADAWRAGILWPHWMHWAAWLAGEPRLTFYPPLSWLAGGALEFLARLHPALPPLVPVVYTFLVLTAAGFAAYSLARTRAAQTPALLCAVLYTVNPYMLFAIYQRTSYGELLAAVWMPLLLRALLAETISLPAIALPLALLWLSDAPAAVMGCYTLALIALVRLVLDYRATRRAKSPLRPLAAFSGRMAAAPGLAIALAAFYVLPAAYERRWVQIQNAIAGNLSPLHNFLFERTDDPAHDAVLRTASWVAVISLTLAAIWLIAAWSRNAWPGNSRRNNAAKTINSSQQRDLLLLTLLSIVILFALTSLSTPLWLHLPQLIYLQFPWRFIAVLSCASVLAMAMALPALSRRWLIAAVAIPALAVPIGYHAFVQGCIIDDEAAVQLTGTGVPFAPTDEYTPIAADGSKLQQYDQSYWIAADIDSPPAATPASEVTPQLVSLEHDRFSTTLSSPALLVVRLLDYPAWRVTIDGHQVADRPLRTDGLMCIPLPAGRSIVDIRYAHTWDNILGDLLSLLALLVLLLLWRQSCRAAAH